MNINEFINTNVENIYDYAVDFRRELHQNPELSDLEFETQKRIIRELEKENIEYIKLANTGILAIIKNGEGSIVATRADIDALPIEEQADVEFVSKNKGVMHACGHDVHTTIQLMVLKILNNMKNMWEGTIYFFFQPAEETTGGALRMLEEMKEKKIKLPNYFFSLHVAPEIEVGKIGIRYGGLHASSAMFEYEINGISSHGALPHLGIDSIIVSSKVIDYLQTIVSRKVDPRDEIVITVGTINGGTATNIVSDKVKMTGTMRFLKEELREEIIEYLKNNLPIFVKSYGASIDIKIIKGYKPVINDFNTTKMLEKNAIDILGKENIEILSKSRMDAEDVGYFIDEIKNGTYYRLGIRNEKIGAIYDLHHPKFKVDEKSMKIGIKMQLKNILEILKKEQNESNN